MVTQNAQKPTVDSMPVEPGPGATDVQRLLDALPVAVLMVDNALRVVQRNALARTWFSDNDRIGQVLSGLDAVDGKSTWDTIIESVRTGCEPRVFQPMALELADDRKLTLRLTCRPQPPTGCRADSGVMIVAEDITDATELRRQLAVSESMAAVGRLAARVAHELNNPLDGSLRYLNLCARQLAESSAANVDEYLKEAKRGLKRMARIVAELLEFSRTHQTYEDSGNINGIIEDAIKATSAPAQRNGIVVVASFLQDRMPHLSGSKLFQVCCNVMKNAIDAMPDGGTLTITALLQGSDVIIRFEDTGTGLPEPIEQVFEPFFTTKKNANGTGLGLAICKDYVEQLGGAISAERGRDCGSVFTVTIPVSRCEAAAPPVAT